MRLSQTQIRLLKRMEASRRGVTDAVTGQVKGGGYRRVGTREFSAMEGLVHLGLAVEVARDGGLDYYTAGRPKSYTSLLGEITEAGRSALRDLRLSGKAKAGPLKGSHR